MGTVSPSFPLDEWWCSCVSETQGNAASGSLDGSGQGVDAAGGAAEAGCDAAPNQTRTCCRARFSSGLKLTQSISFGRLHGHGSQAAPSSVQDGFTDLRIDRHGSMAGNPFHGAAFAGRSMLCCVSRSRTTLTLIEISDFTRRWMLPTPLAWRGSLLIMSFSDGWPTAVVVECIGSLVALASPCCDHGCATTQLCSPLVLACDCFAGALLGTPLARPAMGRDWLEPCCGSSSRILHGSLLNLWYALP